MGFPIAAVITAAGSVLGGMMNKNKQQVQPVPLIPTGNSNQQTPQMTQVQQVPQNQQMGLGSIVGGVQSGMDVMGALGRRQEAIKENPKETLKTGLEALQTLPNLDPNEKNMYLQKIYEAYQKSQSMG